MLPKKKIPVQDAFVNYISTKLGRKIKMLCKEKESYSVDDYLISQLTKIILCLFFWYFWSRSKIFSFHSQDASIEYNSKLGVYYRSIHDVNICEKYDD